MTLLITIFAAVISTVVWYCSEKARTMRVSVLCYMFWGASIMWLVDAIAEYRELGAAYFTPAVSDMVNDTFLGLTIIAVALMIWVIAFLVKDANKIVSGALK